MIVQYYNIEKAREFLIKYRKSKGSETTQRDINMYFINMLGGKFRVLKSDKEIDFNIIYLDPEIFKFFEDANVINKVNGWKVKPGEPMIKGTWMGYVLYEHFPEERYISLLSEDTEVARIYLVDKTQVRENRFKKLMDK